MQALIITAYHNKDILKKNLELFSKHFMCYVHIDNKSDLNNEDYIDTLNKIENVYAISKYRINWGSYYHMLAIVDLMKVAVVNDSITRVHIISGDDFPIKNISEFEQFFEVENRYKNFIELTDIRNMPVMKLRYEKYHFLHIFNRKSKNKVVIYIDKIIRQIQYHLPFKRKISFDYKGLVWSSISIEAVKEIINYVTPKMIHELKFCEIAEEFIVQNALMSCSLADTIVTDKLRYDDWAGQLTGPKVLTIDDKDKINQSNAFFARKIQYTDARNPKVDQLYNLLAEKLQ